MQEFVGWVDLLGGFLEDKVGFAPFFRFGEVLMRG